MTDEIVKEKKTRNRKSTTVDYTVPDGGIRGHVVSDYVVGTHAKLKQADFADVLDYSLWEASFYRAKAAQSEATAERLKLLGSTPEERKEAMDIDRQIRSLEAKIGAARSKSGAAGARMTEAVGRLFAGLQTS